MASNSISTKKATIWGTITLCAAMGLNVISIVLKVLDANIAIDYYDLPQPIVIVIFMLVCAVFYFFPIVKTHYHAKQAGIRWLSILTKILMIHFGLTTALAMIILIINLICKIR